MKEVRGITSLSYSDIACNAVLFGVLCYNTQFSSRTDLIAFAIAGFGIIMSILYAVQLILIKRNYYRHHTISVSAKVLLHICRIITLLYSLMGAFMLAMTVYNAARTPGYFREWDYKFLEVMAVILVTVVMNMTIFFKGWRLLKFVKTPYIEEVMASFD